MTKKGNVPVTPWRGSTWEDVVAAKPGAIFINLPFTCRIRFVVLRGGVSLCAYIGIPKVSILADQPDYKNLPLEVHGGLTFAGAFLPTHPTFYPSLYWYGWDYAHSGDAVVLENGSYLAKVKQWTPAMVLKDSTLAISQMQQLLYHENVMLGTTEAMIW